VTLIRITKKKVAANYNLLNTRKYNSVSFKSVVHEIQKNSCELSTNIQNSAGKLCTNISKEDTTHTFYPENMYRI